MSLQLNLDFYEDKIEFFEAESIKALEDKIQAQIENNKALMLSVHSVSHQMYVSDDGRRFYSAVVHFKLKQSVGSSISI
ncbi:hypothetical protein WQ57_19680 [Mesobacillus campisalis]|uniref:DUF2536 domain-containing protein n=1 Tax=Mesobacillus campisalis TaxID=1408103 RepID=A0A0M2SUV4_9BACI|nr:DUF2536 family protein [Mesobacillus campisalis]KKK36400.1 hypothetical protein WQ57_19680 [Mesobacillus campisalis]